MNVMHKRERLRLLRPCPEVAIQQWCALLRPQLFLFNNNSVFLYFLSSFLSFHSLERVSVCVCEDLLQPLQSGLNGLKSEYKKTRRVTSHKTSGRLQEWEREIAVNLKHCEKILQPKIENCLKKVAQNLKNDKIQLNKHNSEFRLSILKQFKINCCRNLKTFAIKSNNIFMGDFFAMNYCLMVLKRSLIIENLVTLSEGGRCSVSK